MPVIILIIILLLLPVLILMLLPGLIFGGFSNAFSSADMSVPVLNSKTAVISYATEITFSINAILNEGIVDAEKRMEDDFEQSDCDCMEIINPYEDNPVYNANLFVSQYCAYKDKDFQSISLEDMEQILLEHVELLYSFTYTEEDRERTMTEEEINEAIRLWEAAHSTEATDTTEEGEPVSSTEIPPEPDIDATITETWRVYTLIYNGESYFADHIFALSDSQKALADNYAYNLTLFLGDGLLQNVSGWNKDTISSLGNVLFTDGMTEVVYYNQLDERFAGQPYGTDAIGGYGCGPTAMAMVVSSLSEDTIDPVEMADWSYENGYWCKGSGSYHALIPAAAKNWELSVSGCTASEPKRILDALSEGKLVVAIMGKGHFTSSGHFIVLRGIKDGQILVADPASYQNSEQTWDLSLILNEASKNAGSGGPFWIIG